MSTLLFLSLFSFAPMDSIGQKKENGQLFTIHQIDKGQTLSAIAKRYKVSSARIIEINKIELGKGKINDRTGLIEWEFTLKPKVSKEIQFSYQIKHDKDQNINL